MVCRSAAVVLIAGTLAFCPMSLRAQDAVPGQPPTPLVAEEQSPLLVEPTSPVALFDAIVLMVDLERPNLANKYLKELMAQNPEDADILRMRDKHGPGIFLEIANDKRMQPLSVQLLGRMNTAFRRYAADSNRLDTLISDLIGEPGRREIAIVQLRSAGAVAVPRMLAVAATGNDSDTRDAIVYTFARMGRHITPSLHGALESPDERIRTVAIEGLGWLGAIESVPWLWHHAYGPGRSIGEQQAAQGSLARILRGDVKRTYDISAFGAVGQLRDIAQTHFRNEYAWPVDENGQVQLWSWNRAAGSLATWQTDAETASLVIGSRFARQALSMSPERRDLQALALSMRLAFESHLAGWSAPLPTGPGTAHDLALLTGPDTALDMLDLSLKNTNPKAALAALQVLGQIGNRNQLRSRNGQASPIIQAMSHPSFRVQFAAASVVMQLDPAERFAGSSRVVSILTRSLNDSGATQGLAIDPNESRGLDTAGLLGEMGYLPQQAATGQDGFRIAAERGDIGLIAIHAACIRWGLSQTVANLRADARTAGIPIVIYGPESIEPNVRRLVTDYPLVDFVLEGPQSFKIGIRTFLARLTTPTATQEQRAQQRSEAGFWFSHIADGRRSDVFDITRAEEALFSAVDEPNVAGNAVVALGSIATPSAQERLQELAVGQARDAELRETAAVQLAFHIQKHGLLLDRSQVNEVNAALEAAAEPTLRTALSSVVGSLRPTSARVGELLQSLPEAALPTGQ